MPKAKKQTSEPMETAVPVVVEKPKKTSKKATKQATVEVKVDSLFAKQSTC